MPVSHGIGFGSFTEIKQEHLTHLCGRLFATARKIIRKPKNQEWADGILTVFDITAGSGEHPETGAEGSPLILRSLLRQANVPYRLYCIEREAENCRRLQDAIGGDRNVEIHHGDHCQILPALLKSCGWSHRVPFGLIYWDYQAENMQPSLDCFAQIYNKKTDIGYKISRLDLLMYLPATSIKRIRGAFDNKPSLAQVLARIDKQYWGLREPVEGDAFQHTFAVGTNYLSMASYERLNFFAISKERGQALLTELNLTAAEKKQLGFDYKKYEQAMERMRQQQETLPLFASDIRTP